MSENNPIKDIKTITIITEEGDHTFDSSSDCQLVESLTESGTAFIVHEKNDDGELLHTTVYPMPGYGGVLAIEIERS
tara:strand:- start:199 stop:429 length:231 start_codon:yes stop_codon:yes gene_type:complete